MANVTLHFVSVFDLSYESGTVLSAGWGTACDGKEACQSTSFVLTPCAVAIPGMGGESDGRSRQSCATLGYGSLV
jgi:hypothetical protein